MLAEVNKDWVLRVHFKLVHEVVLLKVSEVFDFDVDLPLVVGIQFRRLALEASILILEVRHQN